MTARINIGQLGAGFIGRVHSLAYRNAMMSQRPIPAQPILLTLADIDLPLAQTVAAQYGWERATADWTEIVNDPAVTLFDNAGPNTMHSEPTALAARAGKHVLCEKPLAVSADEALGLYRTVEDAGVLHQCAFMYRSIPAIQHARQLIKGGELGDVVHFRSRFLLSFAADAAVPYSWRFDRAAAGAGASGDLASHHIDLARFLVAEVDTVASMTSILIPERSGRRITNDDHFAAIARLGNGATAVFEGSRVAGNHSLTSRIEVDGTRGSLVYDFERLNELSVSKRGLPGFRTYLVTQSEHPYSDFWLPAGIQGQHPLGWADCFAHQAHAMLEAIANDRQLTSFVATFRDAYRVAEVVDAITLAGESRKWETVHYRDAPPSFSEAPR